MILWDGAPYIKLPSGTIARPLLATFNIADPVATIENAINVYINGILVGERVFDIHITSRAPLRYHLYVGPDIAPPDWWLGPEAN